MRKLNEKINYLKIINNKRNLIHMATSIKMIFLNLNV